MPNQRAQRLVPLLGALFVVLTFASFLIQGEPPDVDEGARKIAAWYVDHDTQTIVAALVAGLAAVALLFFAAYVRRVLRESEQGTGILSVAALAGGIVAATGIATDSALRFTLGENAEDVSPGAVETLHALWSGFFFPMVVGLGTLILAMSLAALGTRVIPTWLAWIGIVIVVVFFTPLGFVSFLLSALWLIVVSVLLWRREAAVSTTGVA
jgi:hypothetical protein